MRVKLEDIEKALGSTGSKINAELLRFAVVTNYSQTLGDDPIIDVFPNNLYAPPGKGN